MKISLDTNAYSDFMRGEESRVVALRTAKKIFLPLIVLGELRAGFAAGNKQSANLASLSQFLNSPRVEVLLPDEQTTHYYAQLYVFLRAKGAAIPMNDLWIAALTVQHGLILCSSNGHFDKLPQIPRC